MKKGTTTIIKILNPAVHLAALTWLYYLYPTIGRINDNIYLVMIWLVAFSIGSIVLNHRFILLLERLKPSAPKWHLFTTWGRVKINRKPDDYFSPEDYQQYLNMFRYMYVFLGLSMVALLILVLLLA